MRSLILACSTGSRVKALISRIPERLSDTIALSSPSSFCRRRKAGLTILAYPRIPSTMRGTGASVKSMRRQSIMPSTRPTPTNRNTLTSVSGTAWAMPG